MVTPASGVAGDDEPAGALLEHVRSRIARYKTPRRRVFTDELPRTPPDKQVEHRLRERYAAGEFAPA